MKARIGRENYYKYHIVKERLENELQVEQPAHQIAGKLKIAVSTFHKYKNLLQLENGRQYMTSDERSFREKQEAAAASTPAPENPKKESSAPFAPQPSSNAEPNVAPAQEAEPKPAKATRGKKK